MAWDDVPPNASWDALPPPSKNKPSMIKKGWDALTLPEQAAKNILPKLTNLQSTVQNKAAQLTGLPIGDEPTGNLTRDVLAGTPKIIGQIGEQIIPGFVSRGSILTAGLLRGAKAAAPLLKMAGSGIAKGAESISGLEYKTPGILTEAAKNPGLIFSDGKKAASPIYEAAKASGGQVKEVLSSIPEKLKVVKESIKLANKGQLNATEALEARKELSAIKKTVTGEYFRKSLAKLNEIAKPVFGEADKVYEKGVRAEELRRIFPVNKSGGTSIMKSTLGTLAGVVPAMAMSPLVQGTAATGVGLAAKAASPLINNPITTAAAVQAAKLASEIIKPEVTQKQAKEYLKKAKKQYPDLSDEEQRKKAIAMAIKDSKI